MNTDVFRTGPGLAGRCERVHGFPAQPGRLCGMTPGRDDHQHRWRRYRRAFVLTADANRGRRHSRDSQAIQVQLCWIASAATHASLTHGPLEFVATHKRVENRPMPPARLDDFTINLVQKIIASVGKAARFPRYSRVRRDVRQGARGERRDGEPRVRGNDRVEPGVAHVVVRGVAAKRVWVGQNHRWRFGCSRLFISASAVESSRSMPGVKSPVAVLTRGSRCAPSLPSFTICRSLSSIGAVEERPSAAVLRLARRMSSSGNRMVVLPVGKRYLTKMMGCRR